MFVFFHYLTGQRFWLTWLTGWVSVCPLVHVCFLWLCRRVVPKITECSRKESKCQKKKWKQKFLLILRMNHAELQTPQQTPPPPLPILLPWRHYSVSMEHWARRSFLFCFKIFVSRQKFVWLNCKKMIHSNTSGSHFKASRRRRSIVKLCSPKWSGSKG